jgi:hypothetical protein
MRPLPGSARPSAALLQFVDDEMLRAPLLFDQLAEGAADRIGKQMPLLAPLQRSATAELLQSLNARRATLADLFTRSLREQVQAELRGRPLASLGRPGLQDAQMTTLALVDEDEVAIDVELAHTIELVKSVAEFELRELQTYTAALVGDMDVTRDHNPFRAETYARALWSAAQGLPFARGFQVQFMRHASEPLAALLRQAYAASVSRLEQQGIEPAAYRTVILPAGARRAFGMDTTYGPDLHQVREVLSTVEPAGLAAPPPTAHATPGPTVPTVPRSATAAGQRRPTAVTSAPPLRIDARSAALVERLFEAIRGDQRVPPDVLVLILRLQPAALRLAQVDADRLADEAHPLWTFVNRVAYEAEMMPRSTDPERMRFLRLAQETIGHMAAEPQQTASLYIWGCEKLESWLRQRLARRCSAAASQIGALQKLEDKLLASQYEPTTLNGALDVPQLDTVPASLLPEEAPRLDNHDTQEWLDALEPGTWVRLFLQGRWVQAQVLWPGERRELWLLGDGATDETWAVRRRALAQLYETNLLKSLTQRSLVRRAAGVVHAQEQARAA